MTVRDGANHVVFESGALHPDGSIEGNDNDADPKRFEPHYTEIRSADQVQIYEPILKDQNGNVTTALLSAVGYAKDNGCFHAASINEPPNPILRCTAGRRKIRHSRTQGTACGTR